MCKKCVEKFLEERQDLACAFRWTAKMGMDEGIANHFSLRVNGPGTSFIINQNKQHFSRIRASDLILLDRLMVVVIIFTRTICLGKMLVLCVII